MDMATARRESRARRTDVHREGALIPAEYSHALHYDLGGSDGRAFGRNCEAEICGYDADNRPIYGKHAPGERCCVATLRKHERFAEHGGPGKCTACGAWFRYGEVWRHDPTGVHIHLGHDCADKFGMLADRSAFEIERGRREHAHALACARAEKAERREAFLASKPGLAAAFECDHRIVRDIRERFEQYGSVSEKQIALVIKLAGEARNPAPAEQHVVAPTGRVTFRGKVVSYKIQDSQYGTQYKIVVKVATDAGVWLCWCTAPASMLPSSHGGSPLQGCDVEITATLERGRDAHFVFGKRPNGRRLG